MGAVLPQPISFGKYTLFERIGRGGMADVFKARVQGPAGFERIFVVKRILPHLSDDPVFTKMFIDEAKLAARLNHPNIVQVFELGSVDNEYFMSMEYVRGRDLAETMRTLWARVGPPRPELVAYVGREMCRALAYAHDFTADDGTRLGMIHRDISPSNVMLSSDGAVKILDFGIAKALGGDKDESTKTGTLKGKFAYMAPEQTVSNEIDRRIDIFATGIVLHEILTGRRLFKGENDLQTIEKVRQCDVPPPSLHNPLCPPEMDNIVLRALAKNPLDRFQSASEMADALDDIVHAARFQPTQLAQLMGSLFPADGGVAAELRLSGSQRSQPSTGSVSPSRSNTSAMRLGAAGSHSSRARLNSATVPPAPPVATGSLPRMSGLTPVVPPPIPEIDLRRKPLLTRKTTWAAAAVVLLVGGAFWAGSRGLLRRPSAPAPVLISPVAPAAPSPEILDLAIQSNPSEAEVFVAGENEALGKTPFRKKFEYREDKSTFLVFRLPGYRELTHEVRPDWSGLVVLDPVPGQPVGEVASSNPAKAGKGGSPVRSSHRKIRKENDLSDKQRKERNLGRAANPF
ncbi:MAG TPA: serine/threonine-protein kinase [Polyangia bacterium]|nr:serine/threonine-protein kinase [Polyangia bacterium]